jgi:AraC-like DNA-binding protein
MSPHGRDRDPSVARCRTAPMPVGRDGPQVIATVCRVLRGGQAKSPNPIDVIARQTGFVDRYRMRRAFLRAFGQPPQVIRRNARVEVAS